MSSAVSSCEISCLSRDIRCVDELVQSSPAAQLATDSASLEMGGTPEHSRLAMRTGGRSDSAARRIESASCCSDDLCKDASASAMLPTARTEFQKVRWMAVDVVVALNWSTRECIGDKAEYPPPKAIAPNLLSINLRI